MSSATQERLREAVLEIAEVITSHARVSPDGNLFWRHPSRPEPAQDSILPGPHLYAGISGIALFFASLGRLTGNMDFRDRALHALAALRREIRAIARDPVRARNLQQPIGGLSGLGSIVYALVRIGDLLGDASLIDDAHLASSIILPELIATDNRFDVMVGSAGAILALLALAERRPQKTLNGHSPLELASLCARHLAAHDEWKVSRSPAAEGFCHGRSGIFNALAQVAARTGGPEPDAGPDPAELERVDLSWCKGMTGIALGRVALSKVRAAPHLCEEAVTAFRIMETPSLLETDDLCCGNCGRLDVLIYGARALEEESLFDKALELAGGILDRAQSRGGFSLPLDRRLGLDLRLFPGMAGIGYSFVRLLRPDLVPCVLAME
jgi:lantibiotic modifying enzyme